MRADDYLEGEVEEDDCTSDEVSILFLTHLVNHV